MKIGRNEPCPCGSGKKYKKCCLNKQTEVQEVRIQPASKMWTLEDVEQMETEALLELLQKFGIPADKTYFISEIENYSSAEELTKLWIENYHLDISNNLSDLTLVIKVLAKRLVPEHLLLDYLDDWMNQGYDLARVNDYTHASLLWWKVWKYLPKWVRDRDIISIGKLDEITSSPMSNLFSNWVQDFDLGLANAKLSDNQFIHTRRIYAEEFLELFPDSDETIIAKMTIAKGESLFYLGKINEADDVFREYVNKHSHNPWAYIHWGDLYNPEMSSKTANKDKAISFYKDAIRIATNESDRDIALDRLYELENVYYRKLRYNEAANHDKFMEIDDLSKV